MWIRVRFEIQIIVRIQPLILNSDTELENRRKSLIQHCERSELRLHFEWTKVYQKCPKWLIWNPEAYGQIVLPDRSILIEQNWWKMPKLANSNATFWVIDWMWNLFWISTRTLLCIIMREKDNLISSIFFEWLTGFLNLNMWKCDT